MEKASVFFYSDTQFFQRETEVRIKSRFKTTEAPVPAFPQERRGRRV